MKIQVQMYTMKTKLGQQWLLLGSYVTKDESHNRKKMRQDGNLKVIRESVKTSKHTKLQFQLHNKLTNIYLFICWKHRTLVSFRVKPKSGKFPSKFVKHFKKFLNVFWRAPYYIHEWILLKIECYCIYSSRVDS